ncbi:MAG: class I SAM-dependent methyltransferase [Xanthobacteraceae bacterium]
MSDWLSFWDKPHSIYVNARHKDAHYRLIAAEIAARVPSSNARVLDYGCGEALHADRVAAVCGALLLSDGAPAVRASIAARFAGNARIGALSAEDVAQLPDRSLDLIVLHSVAQYLTPQDTQSLLIVFHRLLQPNGLLLVSDVIPPQVTAWTDATALLRFGAANGFWLAALAGLARTLFSDYRRLRARIGLSQHSEAEMIAALKAAGFDAHRAEKNMGHSQSRMAFVARPR